MHKFVIGLLAAFSISAHASGSHDLEFVAKEHYEDVMIGWVLADDVAQTCTMAFALNGNRVKYNPNILACAIVSPSGDTCVIYTAQKLSLAILGHEVRHCFEGAWHK